MSEKEVQKLTELLTEVRLEIVQLREKVTNKYDDLERRVNKLEKYINWGVITVIGAIIMALIKTIIK